MRTDVDRKELIFAIHEPEEDYVAKLLGVTHCTHTQVFWLLK